MKSLKKLLAVFLVSAVCLTGCGKEKSAIEVLNDASDKMSKLDNYGMKIDMEMSAKSEGIEMDIPMSIDAKVDEKNKTMHMDLTVSVLGIKVNTESYADYTDGKKVTTYTKDVTTEEWSKTEQENEDGLDSEIAVDIIKAATKIEKGKTEEKDVTLYQLTIEKDKMNELLSDSLSSLGTEDMTEEVAVSKDVVVDIYVNKDGYISKLVMDLSDVVSATAEEEVEFTKFVMTIAFDEFNKVGEIKIPEDVVKNATLTEE